MLTYFKGENGYQNFFVFPPMVSTLKLAGSKKVTYLEPIMPNLPNGRVILKVNNSVVIVQLSTQVLMVLYRRIFLNKELMSRLAACKVESF